MAYTSMREWIETLEQEGELAKIKAEVDWDEEIGGICRQVYNMKENGPALLFENIKGYQEKDGNAGRKMFAGSLTTVRRIALMLGLPKNTHPSEVIRTVRDRIKNPVRPVIVKSGPVKENIKKGDKVNLFEFPVPKWHPFDPGRYMGTFCGIVTKDPITGWVNIGNYRQQILDKNTLGNLISFFKHWGHHYAEYIKMGKPMPVAVVFGWDPVLTFTSCTPYPAGFSEYDAMGALRGKPVELVKCETIDLEVPASAEIVIEGLMPVERDSYRIEGPFGEFPGYYTGKPTLRPVLNVQCITHRNDPIFQGTFEGPSPNEDSTCGSVVISTVALESLQKMGIPGIIDAYCPPCVGNGTSVRVKIRKMYAGHAKQIAACLFAATTTTFKIVTVVEEDIDIHDSDSVEWAVIYRVDPKEDIIVFPGLPGSALDPSSNPEWHERKGMIAGLWNRCLIDATRTWRFGIRDEWRGEHFPPVANPSEEMTERVIARWEEYGLPEHAFAPSVIRLSDKTRAYH
jgi:UbiD family decarboxylase